MKLIYISNVSLDGYIADANGNFDFTAPDADVHQFINDLVRPIPTHLYGRKLYETMVVWEHPETFDEDGSPVTDDFAQIWQAADKIVYSTTLQDVSSARTRIERTFDPDAVREMKASSDLMIGGAHLAAEAFRAGLVDEIDLFVSPIVIGGGNAALPDDVRIGLELLDEHRFTNGVVYLRYRVTG
jgi:dihydrofolate reductase